MTPRAATPGRGSEATRFGQSVVLTLSDGRKVAYFGPAQVLPDDMPTGVSHVTFTEPIPLADGVTWGPVADVIDTSEAKR